MHSDNFLKQHLNFYIEFNILGVFLTFTVGMIVHRFSYCCRGFNRLYTFTPDLILT